MGLTFEWDAEKAAVNARKHLVTFEEALTVFADPLSVTIADPDHSHGDVRYVLVGLSARGRLVVVSHSERGQTIRIINARLASRREKRAYEEGED